MYVPGLLLYIDKAYVKNSIKKWMKTAQKGLFSWYNLSKLTTLREINIRTSIFVSKRKRPGIAPRPLSYFSYSNRLVELLACMHSFYIQSEVLGFPS